MLERAELPLSAGGARGASTTTSRCAATQPHFANARSIRNALDRARLRQANRLFEISTGLLDVADLDDDRSDGHPRQPRLQRRCRTRSRSAKP